MLQDQKINSQHLHISQHLTHHNHHHNKQLENFYKQQSYGEVTIDSRLLDEQTPLNILIEFEKNGKRSLGFLKRKEGRRKWIIIDRDLQELMVHRMDLTFQFSPTSNYTLNDLKIFENELLYSQIEDRTLVLNMWQSVVDKSPTNNYCLSILEACQKLFPNQQPTDKLLYRSNCLLRRNIRFQPLQSGKGFRVMNGEYSQRRIDGLNTLRDFGYFVQENAFKILPPTEEQASQSSIDRYKLDLFHSLINYERNENEHIYSRVELAFQFLQRVINHYGPPNISNNSSNHLKSLLPLIEDPNSDRSPLDEMDELLVDELKYFALRDHRDPASGKIYAHFLNPLCLPKWPTQLLQLLIELRIISPTDNLIALKQHISLNFSAETEAHAQQIVNKLSSTTTTTATTEKKTQEQQTSMKITENQTNPTTIHHNNIINNNNNEFDIDRTIRKDFKNYRAYAIDDSTTRHIDDAISYERTTNGLDRVHIHIADATRLLEVGSQLDRIARQRSSTVYFVDQAAFMLPDCLASGPLSLKENNGQLNYALTFSATIDKFGQLTDPQVFTSRIHRLHSLTYLAVDSILQQQQSNEMNKDQKEIEEDLKNLERIADKRAAYRLQQGALRISLPRTKISIERKSTTNQNQQQMEYDETIKVFLERLRTKSQLLVEEMMIIAGEIAANFSQQHQLMIPFRVQSPPLKSIEKELNGINSRFGNDSDLIGYHSVKYMQKASSQIESAHHFGIGLTSYTRTTSPIRRYNDLLVHHQIKSILRGQKSVFQSKTELSEMILTLSQNEIRIKEISEISIRYWALKQLAREPFNRVYCAKVIDTWVENQCHWADAYLIDFGYLKIHFRTEIELKLGLLVNLIVKQVDPLGYFAEFIHIPEMIGKPPVQQSMDEQSLLISSPKHFNEEI